MDKKQPDLSLHFAGLGAPVDLTGARALLPTVAEVLPRWPFRIVPTSEAATPFLVIVAEDDGSYRLTDTTTGNSSVFRNAVDCVCDLVAQIAWEQIRSNPRWLCLHCAAVEFAGRLVLFPSRHKAGKSTLTAVLAARGHRVFTDDFMAVEIDSAGIIRGRANGVAPRIRLPVPDDLGTEFHSWLADQAGPRNARYRYLPAVPLAPQGESLPIGAIVSLDRTDTPCPASLKPASPEETMDVLIRQNFARILHAGRILHASKGTTETADLYQLTYSSAQEAAGALERAFAAWDTGPTAIAAPARLPTDPARLELLDQKAPALDPSQIYSQAAGATEVLVGDAVYVADPAGLGIQKLNPTSAAIWRMLERPATVDEIADVLDAAFPQAGRARIQDDTRSAFAEFARTRLIECRCPAAGEKP